MKRGLRKRMIAGAMVTTLLTTSCLSMNQVAFAKEESTEVEEENTKSVEEKNDDGSNVVTENEQEDVSKTEESNTSKVDENTVPEEETKIADTEVSTEDIKEENKEDSTEEITTEESTTEEILDSEVPLLAAIAETDEETESEEPVYLFTFDEDVVNDNKVANADGLSGDQSAKLEGDDVEIVQDKERDSEVLYLPGGSTSSGYLTLPDDLFAEASDGFTMGFWVKASADGSRGTHYQRIFESSSTELGKYYQGKSNNWTDPEFTLVVGGGDESDTKYDACINTSDNTKARIGMDTILGEGNWEYVTVSVNKDNYLTYINGEKVKISDLSDNLSKVLDQFFDEIDTFTHNALGQSVYTSDNNAEAYFDNFRFYQYAMDEDGMKKLYEEEDKGNSSDESKTDVPDPYYNFTFEDDVLTDKTLKNTDGLSGEQTAELGGEKAEIVSDEIRKSKVLYLPGGSTTSGYLTLPDDLFSEVEDEFSLSFWVKAKADGSSSTHYQRVFESSSTELGKYYQGVSNNWTDPEFTMVVGGGDESSTRYDACINTSDNTKARIGMDTILGGGSWEYVTVSITKDSYLTYINGKEVKTTDLSGNLSKVLTKFFEEKDSFTHNALGQSVYTSDNNAEAYFDDFRVYHEALSKEQAIAIYTEEYGQSIEEDIDYGDDATVEFNVTNSLGDMFHGSTGFLYGVSEVNVPSMDMIMPLSPKYLVQKAADGMQHPSGDGYRLRDYLTSAGVANVQIYLQDYYLEWPYEYNGISDYQEKVKQIVSKCVDGKSAEERATYSYVLFNEPDGIWYSNNGSKLTTLCEDWKLIYETVKEIDADAKTVGPNFSSYNSNAYKTFFKYCSENDCLPEIISWHDLQKDKLTGFANEYKNMQNLIETYYADSDIKPQILVNETVNFEDIGAPGPLVNWLSIYEEKDVYASLPYWGLANSLNELAADANKPNSAWWVYKWYADMQGYKTEMNLYNVNLPSSSNKGDRLYGLCSVDVDNQTVSTIFGGHEGTQNISFKNIGNLEAFQDADKAHVKIYRTRYSGQQGFAIPTVIYDDILNIGDNKAAKLVLEDCDLLDAYYAIVTPAREDADDTSVNDAMTDDTMINDTNTSDVNTNDVTVNGITATSAWTEIYEAEDATLLGSAKAVTRTGGSDLARSNRADVTGIYSESDGVEYKVTVPEEGVYEARIYYSVAAPYVNATTLEVDASGQNRAIGQVVKNRLVVDGDDATEQIMTFDSTVKAGYYNYESVYVNLSEGTHTIKVTHYGASQKDLNGNIRVFALQDKMELRYEGESKDTPEAQISFEEIPSEQYQYQNTIAGYTSGGYKEGKGDIQFTVAVKEDGLYDTDLTYAANKDCDISVKKTSFAYGVDATATAEVAVNEKKVVETTVGNTDEEFDTVSLGKIYLTAGVNTILMNSNHTIALDELHFALDASSTEATTITYEAETGDRNGDVNVLSNEYASGSRVVDGIGGGEDDNTLTMNVNVPSAGDYKLSIFYANDEPAPVMETASGKSYVHPYNTDLVERYAQITVNKNKPMTVYFRNTLSWDVIRNVVIDVTLQAGDNTITFANDNSYKFSKLQNDYAPRFDKISVTPAYESASYVAKTDKTTLYKAILNAKTYDETNYTKASFSALTEQITKAQSYYDGSESDTTTIENILSELQTAEKDLVSLSSVRNTIEAAKGYEASEYTKASFKALQTAITQAEALLDKEDATKDELSDAEKAIKEKITMLQTKYPLISNATGTITTSATAGSHAENAWDGDSSTYPDLVTSTGGWDNSAAWTQIAFAEPVTIAKISFANRSGYLNRLIGGVFYGSLDGENYDVIYTVESVEEGYNTVTLDTPVQYTYIRYNAPVDAYLNVADIRLYGVQVEEADPDEGKDDKPSTGDGNEGPIGDGNTSTEAGSGNSASSSNEDNTSGSSNHSSSKKSSSNKPSTTTSTSSNAIIADTSEVVDSQTAITDDAVALASGVTENTDGNTTKTGAQNGSETKSTQTITGSESAITTDQNQEQTTKVEDNKKTQSNTQAETQQKEEDKTKEITPEVPAKAAEVEQQANTSGLIAMICGIIFLLSAGAGCVYFRSKKKNS